MKDNNMVNILRKSGERFAKTPYRDYRYLQGDEKLIWQALSAAEHTDLKEPQRLRIKYNFTVTKGTKESTENILERAIAAVNNLEGKTFFNQYPFNKGEHIDLVRKSQNMTEIIELKQWNNDKDSPLYALIEILKYYHLLADKKHTQFAAKTFLPQKEITDLTVLAPTQYFDNFPVTGALETLAEKLANLISGLKGKGITISFKSFDLSQDEFDSLKYSLKDKNGNTVKELLTVSNKAKNISWDTPYNMQQLSQYKDKLLWKNWRTLWPGKPL